MMKKSNISCIELLFVVTENKLILMSDKVLDHCYGRIYISFRKRQNEMDQYMINLTQ